MSSISTYLLTVVSTAVICAIVNRFFEKKDGVSAVIHLLAGVFLTITVMRPIIAVKPMDFLFGIDDYSAEAASVVEEGEELANSAMQAFIKEQTEAYILVEAEKLQLQISVEVRLSESNPPVPQEITIFGALSPYAKSYLTNLLTKEIGISKENLIWIG